MQLCSHVIMYVHDYAATLRVRRTYIYKTSVMYTTENIHIWSMRLCSHVIMYIHDYTATPRGIHSYMYKRNVISILGAS